MSTTIANTPTPTNNLPADHPAHANLNLFLRLLLILGPAAAAPFIRGNSAQAIFQAEVPLVESLAQALSGQPPA